MGGLLKVSMVAGIDWEEGGGEWGHTVVDGGIP